MIRFVLLVVAHIFLYSSTLSSFRTPKLLPLSEDQHASVLTILKLLLACCSVRELNGGLNRWAENKWMWKDDKSAWDWKAEVAVVTGGSRGIGAMVAQRLASYGIRVAVLDIVPLSDELLSDEKTLVSFYQCDITSRHAVHEAGQAIRSDHGSPSILINNAGIGNANSILEVSPERLRTIFDINLLSHWNTVQEFLPDMIAKKKGHIMSTASLAAFMGLAGMVDYSCTKAGMLAFYEGLTQELKHRYQCPQIKTSIVFPNWTRTHLTEALQERLKTLNVPMMDPKEVAEAMVKQVLAVRSGQLILGPSLSASIRAFPAWLQELIRDQLANVVTANATSAEA